MKFYESEEIKFLADRAIVYRALMNSFVGPENPHCKVQYFKTLANLEHRLLHDFDENGNLIRITGEQYHG